MGPQSRAVAPGVFVGDAGVAVVHPRAMANNTTAEKAQKFVQGEIEKFREEAVGLALCAAFLQADSSGVAVADCLQGITVEELRERLAGVRSFDDLAEGSRLQGLVGLVTEARHVDEIKSSFRGPCRFSDHAEGTLSDGKALMREPTPGRAVLEWCVGLTAAGEPVRLSFDHEEPHVLIGGSAQAGKSTAVRSMLSQLAGNNTTDDLEVWFLASSHEHQMHADIPHVRRFESVDPVTGTTGSAYTVAASLFSDLHDEMERRLELLVRHADAGIANLRDARKAGLVDLPYIVLAVDECSSFFAPPPPVPASSVADETSKLSVADRHKVMMHQVSELARKGRAFGIHMVFVYQGMPKNAMPATLKRHCQRIGIRTFDRMSSLGIIDRTGLERLEAPGLCMVTNPDGGYINTRAFHIDDGTDHDGLPEAA